MSVNVYRIQKQNFQRFRTLFIETSRERPKTAPYLRLNKTRKPLFLQLETTKTLKKLKIEENIFPNFFRIFLKSPVSRIVPKNVKGGTFGIFWTTILLQNIKKMMRGPCGAIKQILEKMRNLNSLRVPKKRKSHSVEKSGKGDPSTLEWLFIPC